VGLSQGSRIGYSGQFHTENLKLVGQCMVAQAWHCCCPGQGRSPVAAEISELPAQGKDVVSACREFRQRHGAHSFNHSSQLALEFITQVGLAERGVTHAVSAGSASPVFAWQRYPFGRL